MWVIQGEKQILGNNYAEQPRFDHAVGGLYHMDAKGTIKGEMQSYIRDYEKAVDE